MEREDDQPQKVTFPRWAWIAMGALLGAQALMLVLNNVQIGAQLGVVKQQRDFQAQADPLVRDGRILTEDLRDRLPQTKRAARDAAALVRAARPLVGDLNSVDVEDVLTATGSLAQGLITRNRVVRLVDRSDRLVANIQDTGLIDRSARLLRRFEQSGVIEDAARAAQRTPEFMNRIERIQRDTLGVQRQTLAVQRELLAIQKEALERIKSIDNKTGGPAPGAAPLP
jgi:predicted transcriptional regulator